LKQKVIKEIKFPSESAILRGLLFLPEAQKMKLPIIIMVHETSATVYMAADRYSSTFD